MEYQAIFRECQLFELASHTYSHPLLCDYPLGVVGLTGEQRAYEIRLGKEIVEQTFGRPCIGIRTPWGFANGLRGDTEFVDQVVEAGFSYVSSLLWGPDFTIPTRLEPPFSYANKGHPGLWEMPAYGWQENLLKGHSLDLDSKPRCLITWSLPFPEAIPLRICPITTPEEEFAINRIFAERAVEFELPYVSLIWHPWSLGRFKPDMRLLELTFSFVRDLGLEPTTYEIEWKGMARY